MKNKNIKGDDYETRGRRMKLLVCGSRKGFSEQEVHEHLDRWKNKNITVLHGGAPGVDSYTESWCTKNNKPSTVVRPKDLKNKLDYLFRNCVMIGKADCIYAFWNGTSKGTKFTWDYAQHYGLVGSLVTKNNKEVE